MEENPKDAGSLTRPICKEQIQPCSLTEKLDQMLSVPSPAESDRDSPSPWQQAVQEREYKRRLLLFQEAQQKQAQLVQRLQTKVLQYKSRCGQLEGQVLEKTSDLEKMRLLLQAHKDSAQRQVQDLSISIRSKVAQLEEEQRRCGSLSQVNCVLREQLEEADALNQGLVESLQKVRQDAELCDTRLRHQQEASSCRLSREQARVRSLWRQAASLRNSFTQLRTFADRTLSDMRGECVAVGQQLRVACHHLEATQESSPGGTEVSALEQQLKDKLREAMQLQGRWDAEKVELKSRIMELTDALTHLRSQNSEKDASLDRMETSRSEDKGELEVLQAENQTLQKVLHEVHQLVSREVDGGGLLDFSPRKIATLKAVQEAFDKHKQQTQDLRVRLEASLNEANSLRTRLQQSHSARTELEVKIQEVAKESQEVQKALEETVQEKDGYRSSLDTVSREKYDVEQLLAEARQECNTQRGELEALRRQRRDVELQLGRLRSNIQRSEQSLEELEGKHSDARRELVAAKEALNQSGLEKEVLEEDKASLALALSKAESRGMEQEALLAKMRHQEAELKDSLAKMAALSEGLAKDKVELNRLLLQAEAEKAELGDRHREAEAERALARDEVAQLQREKTDTLMEKEALESSQRHLWDLRRKTEEDLERLQKENARNLQQRSQVSRQVQSTSEELCESRRQLDEQEKVLEKVTADRDALAKDKAALEVRLGSAERKSCDLARELLALRAEKQSLETNVFQTQELASSLEVERSRVEAENRSLLSANEALTRDVARVRLDAERELAQVAQERSDLEEKLVQAERKTLQSLKNSDELHREQLEDARRQQEQKLTELMRQLEQLRSLNQQLAERSRDEVQKAKEEMLRVQQDCKRSIMKAHNENQQALSQKDAEKTSLVEELAILQQDLKSVTSHLELTRKEAFVAQEQDKNEISVLRRETLQLRADLEAWLKSHEAAEQSGREKLRELSQQQQAAQQQVEALQAQLQHTEEQLAEARQSLQESSQGWEKQRKEALNLRRLLEDETSEKEAIHTSNQELRASIKRAESDNSSLRRALEGREQQLSVLEERSTAVQQEASTLRSSMREIEKSRLQARRRNQELRRQLKVLEGEKQRQEQELKQLQAQLCQEEQQQEEARRQAFGLKQKVLECEAARDAATNQASSLQRRVLELEEAERQGKELLQVQQARQQLVDQKHRDQAARLQRSLEDAALQTGEVSARLDRAEAAALDLERRLRVSESRRGELERKVSAVGSALRRLRLTSPRRRLPLQGSAGDGLTSISTSCADDEELDLDFIQDSLQDFQRELRDTQRERDESKAQLVMLSEQVSTLQDKSAGEVSKLHKSLKQFKDEHREMQERLRESQTSFFLHREAERDKAGLEEEVTQLRSALLTLQVESKSLKDKLDGSQANAHEEHERLNEALEEARRSNVRLELAQGSLEAELQCARQRASQLEAETTALRERLTKASKKLVESEAALRVGEERQSAADRRQGQLGEQVRALIAELSKQCSSQGALQENLKQLHRAMTDSETERQLLQDRLNESRDALAESKKLNRSLMERSQTLKREQEDLELRNRELDKQKMSLQQSLKMQQGAQQAAREKVEQLESKATNLEIKVTNLQVALQQLRREKADMEKAVTRLGKDKGALRKSLEKAETNRRRTEEEIARETQEALICLERQLVERQDQVTALKSQIGQLEQAQAQRLLEVTARHHQEMETATERLRQAQLQAQQALESREKAHRQRVRCLEDQVSTLKEQLDEETRRRQACVHKMLRPGAHSSM
ncbi:rootletin isoform X2 [Syngnathus scovelli]|nr:rootletin isoform X2 [Syngnathus scovelli]XP_049578497.1 rootletin isoform X2 [Syngnathus scovelli]XP_049578505.1 rootletin isoform X2 [Syngnathus scovelli]